MPNRSSERDEATGTFEFFSKEGKFRWGGAFPDANPGSLPDNMFCTLINTRNIGGSLRPRGGQIEVTKTSPLHDASACVIGGGTLQIGTPLRLYIFQDGCPGVSGSIGFTLGWQDHEQSPYYQPGVYYDAGTQGMVGQSFGGDIYLGQDNKLRKLQNIRAPYGVTALDLSGSSQDIILKRFDGYTKITWMMEFDSKLFIALDGGAGTSKVVYWDGLQFVDDLTGINPPTGMFRWRDKLILGYAGAPNNIRVRSAGAGPGTWAVVAPGAGTVRMYQDGVSFRGTAYWINATNNEIWSYDGTTLQNAHSVAAGAGGAAVLYGIALFNNLVYFCDSTASNNGRIGFYDGTTWVDSHNTIQTSARLKALKEYRGKLNVAGTVSGLGTIWQSPRTDTAGTYTSPSLGALSADIDQILVA